MEFRIEMQKPTLRVLAIVQILISVFFITLTIWPISGACSGRALGLDCESWFIFGVNIFAPIGVLALACGIWILKKSGMGG